ncbi:DEAD/DEAH box helicase [Pseudomonas sp. WS 5059]|uniref:DEAD/DEAH box helicase n=1 Tax=Pseudomonas sp. WS 5059 TaxID=2717491 RepID=UPI0014743E71|nr:type ISP restriction/modification enzyme [Pseudomonas sp. WS 5059]NMY06393.1 DEAD/DEAH box helicase [Pseudomonas sp. WS 5059]
MSALASLLDSYRNASVTEREKGTYFEELICTYLRNEAQYRDLYEQIWTFSDWAKEYGEDGRDTGIDLVARTQGTKEFHAIQCKMYAENYRVQKGDIDSFLASSGQKPFTHSIIVTTTNNWSEHADNALLNRHQAINKIDLQALEDSQIDWVKYKPNQIAVLKAKKSLRDHQKRALLSVTSGLQGADRGKLIMACGTGKTFTSLKIAEQLAGEGKRVLFLVPSLSLLSQTLTEWTQESEIPLHSFAVCSDSDVGKKRKKDDDIVQTFAHELRYPATTDSARLAAEMLKRHEDNHMSVVFSTYHSIGVISDAQHLHGLAEFDLIVCDEAHRTTGATFDDDESAFVKVHNADYIRSAKRLYMTATPRIYGELAKASAEKDDVALCSMDDDSLYGKELFVITFSEAVKTELLVDYKVLVLAMDEKHISSRLQKLLADDDNQIKLEDAAKIIGCWKALSKQDTREDLVDDGDPMRRAVAFCQVIEYQKFAKTHKVSSKNIANMFKQVVEEYKASNPDNDDVAATLICEASHVDGGMTAGQKEDELTWLKAEVPDNTCRILSNVRCLSEGVDVPALDAVLFLTPRNSQVDVVQSVGRVMRKAEGKKRGYVILPVVIPSNMSPEDALNDNKTYKVVWQVLQALRSHDDRFDAMVNKLDLIGSDPAKMEVIAVTEKLNKKSDRSNTGKDTGKNTYGIGEASGKYDHGPAPEQFGLEFEIGEIERAIYAKVVKKCGNRSHWEDWAKDIAKIAHTHIIRITSIIENEANIRERDAFFSFAGELRDDLNDSISDGEVIEMLAQHLITKPVFDALFEGYSFASSNPMSCAMQNVLDVLQEHHLDKEADTLQRFYDSVKMRAEGIDNAEGKQKIIVELYNKFFKNAFPRMSDRLGIVYTPVEVVDFIIHSVNEILQSEFGQTLGSDGVHIIDPFTGTGTFITRLLQSGLISKEQLQAKYQGQIHANEIVLLAYYIAAINIEAVYHSIVGGEYQPFEGICLTDTFQLYEKDDLVSELLVDNSARRTRQKALDIRVIIGNPPYSVGQESANDNNQNIAYPHLDSRIRATYVEGSNLTLTRSLYDSYIRAIRWASDRIGNSGIIGYVSGSGFVDKAAMSGMRKALAEEFTTVYVLNLRGDIRKNMLSKGRAKEGENIFAGDSMTGVAITLFVKNPASNSHGNIFYHDIGDDLTLPEKLERLRRLVSVSGVSYENPWQTITPDVHNDWLRQRDDGFGEFIKLGGAERESIFRVCSPALMTNRDTWCVNYSDKKLRSNINKTLDFYNSEVERLAALGGRPSVDDSVSLDSAQISWSRALRKDCERLKTHAINTDAFVRCSYRPFTNSWIYIDKSLVESRGKTPDYFTEDNKVITVSGKGSRSGFSALMLRSVGTYDTLEKAQCFPLFLYGYEEKDAAEAGLFKEPQAALKGHRRDAITDEGLAHFSSAYPGEVIRKEDLFYYVYGLLHSPEYRDKYADNLSKELPRIPAVKAAADFWAYSKAGRALAELHIDYEAVAMYPANVQSTASSDGDYRVTKMKYGKKGKDKDLTILHYNAKITVTGIPLQAYDYIVNGKPALDWVVERQCVSTHKDSGITNDANDWAIETMSNPKYPLELFLRVVTVSLETMKIVKALPPLDI